MIPPIRPSRRFIFGRRNRPVMPDGGKAHARHEMTGRLSGKCDVRLGKARAVPEAAAEGSPVDG